MNLVQVLQRAIEHEVQDLHTALPARIESYDSGKNRAVCQPLLKRGYIDETGVRAVESYPPIPDVPVIFPGAGGIRVRFPISRGDIVLLIFAEGSLDSWKSKPSAETDSGDDRRHSLEDAFAIPVAWSNASPLIEFTNSEIRAGGSAALGTKADLDNLRIIIDTVTQNLPAGSDGKAFGTALTNALVTALWPLGTNVLKGS